MPQEAGLLERRVGHHRDVLLAQPRPQVPRDPAPREVVKQLVGGCCCAAWQRMEFLHVGEVEVADPEVADLAGGLQFHQGLERFRKRHAAPPVQEVQVYTVRAEPLEACLAGSRGAAPRGVFGQHLAHEEHFVTAPGDGFADQRLRATVAVHLGGVDERQALVEPQAQRGQFSGALLPAVAHVPGALSQCGNPFARRQRNGFHSHSVVRHNPGRPTWNQRGKTQCAPRSD